MALKYGYRNKTWLSNMGTGTESGHQIGLPKQFLLLFSNLPAVAHDGYHSADVYRKHHFQCTALDCTAGRYKVNIAYFGISA